MTQLSKALSESVRCIIGEKLPELAIDEDSPTPMYSEVAELAIHILTTLLKRYDWEYDLGFTLCSEHDSCTAYLSAYHGEDTVEYKRAGSTPGEAICALIVAFNERVLESKLIVDVSITSSNVH